jgi:hypothetical protein
MNETQTLEYLHGVNYHGIIPKYHTNGHQIPNNEREQAETELLERGLIRKSAGMYLVTMEGYKLLNPTPVAP